MLREEEKKKLLFNGLADEDLRINCSLGRLKIRFNNILLLLCSHQVIKFCVYKKDKAKDE